MTETRELINGDCLQVFAQIPDASVDLCLTDPPYGTTGCRWDEVIPFELMWKHLERIMKPTGAVCIFGTEPFSSRLRVSNLENFKFDWVWDKVKPSGFQVAKYKPMQRHEFISVFCKGRLNYYPIFIPREKVKTDRVRSKSTISFRGKIDSKKRVYTHKNPVSFLVYSNANQRNRKHPTQKPVELLMYLINTHSKKGETVLDFAMGSGSTGVACKKLKRNFIGIEKDRKYFDIAKERIEAEY